MFLGWAKTARSEGQSICTLYQSEICAADRDDGTELGGDIDEVTVRGLSVTVGSTGVSGEGPWGTTDTDPRTRAMYGTAPASI